MKNQSARRKFKVVFNWIIRVLLVQLLLINISAAFHAHRITHYYDDDRVRNLPPSAGTVFLRTWRLMVGRKFPKSLVQYYPPGPYDTVQLLTSNKNKIEGWWMKADSSIGTVILFHGLSSNKGRILAEADEFLSMGYNTLLIDMRAHGNSSGTANSLGVKESEEVKLAFDFVKQKDEKNIILWGMSLGAVIITRAVYDYDISPQKIILEMPFDRVQDHIRARARVLGFPDEPFGFFVTLWAGIEQGYWGFGHTTSKYIKKITCPVLLQWGANDKYVLRKETENIFTNITVQQKTMVVYEEGGHASLLGADADKWRKSVSNFLKNP
jgi:alpha-beta hydrolase superfamily lysophospholipase